MTAGAPAVQPAPAAPPAAPPMPPAPAEPPDPPPAPPVAATPPAAPPEPPVAAAPPAAPPEAPPEPAFPPVPTLPPVPEVPPDDEQPPIEIPPTTNAPVTNHDALFIWFPLFDQSMVRLARKLLYNRTAPAATDIGARRAGASGNFSSENRPIVVFRLTFALASGVLDFRTGIPVFRSAPTASVANICFVFVRPRNERRPNGKTEQDKRETSPLHHRRCQRSAISHPGDRLLNLRG